MQKMQGKIEVRSPKVETISMTHVRSRIIFPRKSFIHPKCIESIVNLAINKMSMSKFKYEIMLPSGFLLNGANAVQLETFKINR